MRLVTFFLAIAMLSLIPYYLGQGITYTIWNWPKRQMRTRDHYKIYLLGFFALFAFYWAIARIGIYFHTSLLQVTLCWCLGGILITIISLLFSYYHNRKAWKKRNNIKIEEKKLIKYLFVVGIVLMVTVILHLILRENTLDTSIANSVKIWSIGSMDAYNINVYSSALGDGSIPFDFYLSAFYASFALLFSLHPAVVARFIFSTIWFLIWIMISRFFVESFWETDKKMKYLWFGSNVLIMLMCTFTNRYLEVQFLSSTWNRRVIYYWIFVPFMLMVSMSLTSVEITKKTVGSIFVEGLVWLIILWGCGNILFEYHVISLVVYLVLTVAATLILKRGAKHE